MALYIGIDPGLSGAVAVLNRDGRLLYAGRTPVVRSTGKAKTQYDLPSIVSWLEQLESEYSDGVARVALEQVGAMPHDGVSSAFRFGAGWGMWRGLLAALRLPTVLVRPQAWQSVTLAGYPRGKSVKVSAVTVAKELFPSIPIKYKADWGMADAALIAEWVRREHGDRG